jgi:translocation and assembly module TamB
VTFTGTQELNPLVQATAEYGVQLVGREALDIRLVIGGTMRNPRLTLESDAQPPISQSDLLSYLAFGRSSSSLLATEGGSSAGGSAGGSGLVGQTAALARNQLTGVALGVFVGQLQSEAARSLGADVLNITPADLPPELSAGGVSTFLRGTEVEYGKYWNTRTFVGLQARPEALGDLPGLISGRPGKAPPGARYQYRTQKGYQFEASVQPRYELTAPSLATTTPSKFGVLGLFVTREWRF